MSELSDRDLLITLNTEVKNLKESIDKLDKRMEFTNTRFESVDGRLTTIEITISNHDKSIAELDSLRKFFIFGSLSAIGALITLIGILISIFTHGTS